MKRLKQCNINNKHIMKRLKQCNIYAHIHPHSTLPLDLSSNFDLGAPRKALITASVSTNSSLKTMEQSDLGAFAPDCYGVVPSRVQEMTAEQPPHAGVLPEA